MHTLCPADELSEVRAEIARLKLREAALRAGFIKAPIAGAVGRWNRVEVHETCQQVFDASLLPENIRKDAQYSREHIVQIVRCLPLQSCPTPRPGWPMKREGVHGRTNLALH